MYVGRATDLRDRWQGRGHHRYYQARNLAWPRLAYTELPKRAINRAERQLIERVQPPWNGSPVPKRAQWWKFGVEMLAAGVVCWAADRYWQEITQFLNHAIEFSLR